jgi:hypothetical protein
LKTIEDTMPPRTDEEQLLNESSGTSDDGAFSIAETKTNVVNANNANETSPGHKQVVEFDLNESPSLRLSIEPTLCPLIYGDQPQRTGDICNIGIESCVYDKTESADRSGAVGDVTLQLYISPPGWEKKALVAWKPSQPDDVSTMEVLKAKTIQENAKTGFPQKNVDVYASTTFGDPGSCVIMKLRTFETIDGQPPKLRLELVLRMSIEE